MDDGRNQGLRVPSHPSSFRPPTRLPPAQPVPPGLRPPTHEVESARVGGRVGANLQLGGREET
jgi:hypothetical protein